MVKWPTAGRVLALRRTTGLLGIVLVTLLAAACARVPFDHPKSESRAVAPSDEYFQIGSEVDFADFDLLGFGPMAPMVSETFDLFWNSGRAVPMEAFGRRVSETDLEEIRQEMAREIEQATDGVYAKAVNSRFLDDVMQGRIEPFVAPVTVVTDRPEKLENPVGDEYKARHGRD